MLQHHQMQSKYEVLSWRLFTLHSGKRLFFVSTDHLFIRIYLIFLSPSSDWSRLQQPLPEPLQGVPALEASPVCRSHVGGRPKDCLWGQGTERGRITGMFIISTVTFRTYLGGKRGIFLTLPPKFKLLEKPF